MARATAAELKKRWDHTLRIWYNKALPPAERKDKRASNDVHIDRLLALIEDRDYERDSRPGPKKGAAL